ncbi:MAG: hypothetical protein IKL04_08180 [Lachnospiraceae bacterium]|nr:hypothetical protein [Lachnospiraceae bacterium]
MSHTNSTANLALPQFIGTDKPTWLSDVNGAFAAIDSYAGSNDAALAITDGKADTAIADASNAVTTAGNAATTAGNAAATATAANTVAGNALTVANGINSKVGVLTDLTTTDKSTVVNAINEVNGKDAGDIAYDNTGSGLTATNVQDAIDEVAQGGGGGSAAWTQIGTQTGSTAIAISGTYNELCLVAASSSDQHIMTIVIPTAELDNTSKVFRDGGSLAADNYWGVTISVTASSAQLGSFVVNGADNTASAVLTVYGR